MNFDRIRRIYFIGICGTAMASLAGLLKAKGYDVCGSDANVYPPMSTQLQELGIRLYSGYRAENLKEAAPDLVIPGNAVPRGNPEVEALLNSRLPYMSMAEAAREFLLRQKIPIVVAGTHGKTTTSSMAAWLLESAGLHPSFLVGGIPINFGNSFRWAGEGKHFVIEGDEYDTGFMDRRPKFVQYLPQFVLLNSVEFDHADLYPDFAAVENAFWQFIKVIPGNGVILVNRDSDAALGLARRGYSRVVTFGFHPESDYRVHGESWSGNNANFQVNGEKYCMPVFGRHNVANAAGIVALGKEIGMTAEEIRRGFAAFQGVKRRMEVRGEVNGVTVYDDFAHHPTAIHMTLEGARLAFPQGRIWGIFEPRSWSSRRSIFQHEFARSFGFADIAVIAGVFEPEKLSPDVRLDPEKLVADIRAAGTPAHYIPETEKIIEFVMAESRKDDRLILMSNGAFNGLHDKLLQRLKERS